MSCARSRCIRSKMCRWRVLRTTSYALHQNGVFVFRFRQIRQNSGHIASTEDGQAARTNDERLGVRKLVTHRVTHREVYKTPHKIPSETE